MMDRLVETLGISLLFVLALLVLVGWPLTVVWAINTLFRLGLPYTAQTWLASVVLLATIHASRREKEGC